MLGQFSQSPVDLVLWLCIQRWLYLHNASFIINSNFKEVYTIKCANSISLFFFWRRGGGGGGGGEWGGGVQKHH